jgi:site-specific DNA recombinase
LKKYRAALEADADPTVVAGWMAEVQRERSSLELQLGQIATPEAPDAQQIMAMIENVADIATEIAKTDPKARMALYQALNLDLTYDQEAQRVSATINLGEHGAEARVVKSVSARGLEPPRGFPH